MEVTAEGGEGQRMYPTATSTKLAARARGTPQRATGVTVTGVAGRREPASTAARRARAATTRSRRGDEAK